MQGTVEKKKFKWTKECDHIKIIHEFGVDDKSSDFFGAVFDLDGASIGIMSDGESYTRMGIVTTHNKTLTPMTKYALVRGVKNLRAQSKVHDDDVFSMRDGLMFVVDNMMCSLVRSVWKSFDFKDTNEFHTYMRSHLLCKKVFSTMDRLHRKFEDNKRV